MYVLCHSETVRSIRQLASLLLISVTALSKVWVYGHSLAGIVGSNCTGGMDVCRECYVVR